MNASLDFGDAYSQLDGLSKRVSDKQAAANAIGSTLLSLIRNGFNAGVSPSGAAWLPLKIRVGGDPLVDTGALRDSITATVSNGGDEIDLETDKVQANIQQFGGTITPKNSGYLAFMGGGGHPIFAKSVTIPARPYMPDGDFSQSWADAIDTTIATYYGLEKS